MINTTGKLASFCAFLSPLAPSLRIRWSDSLATILPPLATRHYPLRPSPAGYCLTPTAVCQRPNGVRSRRTAPSIFSMSPNQAIPAEKSIRFFPLAAAQPLNILSRPEMLNATGSRRPCRMAISRNACSLVPALISRNLPKELGMVSRELLGTIALLDLFISQESVQGKLNRLALFFASL